MTLTQASLVEPLAVGLYAVRFLDAMKNKSIGILGTGPIGLSVLLTAKTTGAGPIYMTDKIKARLKAACSAGADWVGNPDFSDIVKDILGNEPLGLDAVFECCGDQAALDQSLELLKPGGSLLLLGIPLTNRISFKINSLRRKEIVVQNVRRQNRCFPATLALVTEGRVDINFMETHTFRLGKVQEAFALAADYRDGIIKATIVFD